MSLDVFTSYNDDKATVNTRDKNRRVLEEPDSSRTVIKRMKTSGKNLRQNQKKKKRKK
jgi:hypothetical protein